MIILFFELYTPSSFGYIIFPQSIYWENILAPSVNRFIEKGSGFILGSVVSYLPYRQDVVLLSRDVTVYSYNPYYISSPATFLTFLFSVSASLMSNKAMWIASKIEDKSENRVLFDCPEKLHEKEQCMGMSADYLDQHPGQL